jgi:hypothetical protein
MVERTRQFLLSRRDGRGGFQRKKDFHSFGAAPDHIVNAYIVWALTEGSAEDELDKETALLVEQAQGSKDPYFLALVANSLLNRGRGDIAAPLLRQLANCQVKEGYLAGAQKSIVGSRGRDLHVETTALAVLAWLKGGRTDYREPLQAALVWLARQRGGYGGFG